MKLRYMSDLHLEFGLLPNDPEPCDVLVLAGDITVKNRVEWINIQAKRFNNVIYVLGNHEYYRQNLDNAVRKTRENLDSSVHLLQNESVTLNGVTFHGTCLWTDFNKGDPLTYMDAKNQMNDFKLIRADHGVSHFSPQRAHTEHNVAKLFLDDVKKDDVVITHMAPSFQSVHPRYKGQKLNGVYASNLEYIMLELAPKFWIHGHMHDSADYTVGNTRVLCNPRGYVHEENPAFNLNAEVEI